VFSVCAFCVLCVCCGAVNKKRCSVLCVGSFGFGGVLYIIYSVSRGCCSCAKTGCISLR
jgi:hypothetical protein